MGKDLDMRLDGWQPIETAPKDETRALFFAPANKGAGNQNARYDQMRVDRRRERFSWRHAMMLPEAPYTHWMPLPPPPSVSGEKES